MRLIFQRQRLLENPILRLKHQYNPKVGFAPGLERVGRAKLAPAAGPARVRPAAARGIIARQPLSLYFDPLLRYGCFGKKQGREGVVHGSDE